MSSPPFVRVHGSRFLQLCTYCVVENLSVCVYKNLSFVVQLYNNEDEKIFFDFAGVAFVFQSTANR